MIEEIKLNGLDNKPIKTTKKPPPRSIYENLPPCYFTSIFIGSKGSGKTYSLIKLLKNLAGKYVLLIMVTSSQDKTCDTKKFLNGNPILISRATQSTVGATNVLYNASEFFYNIDVPTNIFSQGYVE
jgi:hypothetical protein